MKKQIISLTMATLMAISTLHPLPVHAADTTTITTKAYVELLEKYAGGKKIETTGVAMGKKVSYADVAVLADRADIVRNGKKETAALKKIKSNVESKKRISDLAKIPKVKRAEVISCFSKGIFTGKSNGTYSQSDSLSTKLYINKSQAKTIASRVKNLKNRKKITTDGQVIRTTKLPKNYKSYDYILENLPNSFYEKKFTYQNTTYDSKPVYLVDYSAPKDVEKGNEIVYGKKKPIKDFIISNRYNWCKKIENNLRLRLNYDYRTSGNKWITDFRNTYYLYNDPSSDKKQTDVIKKYASAAKKNKVVLKSAKIIVEPSTLYYSSPYYLIRCYVKFKVVSANIIPSAASGKQSSNLIFGESVSLTNLKKNQWYEGYFDLGLSTSTYGGDGSDYGVSHDYLIK